METAYFKDLLAYNSWANAKMIDWIDSLTEDQRQQEIQSSFPSIFSTALHILGAEYIWLQRLSHVNETVWVPAVFKGTWAELSDAWGKASHDLELYIADLKTEILQEIIPYRRINGEKQQLAVYQILAHVANHSSYHRGQLVTMLRQVGFTNITSLDLMQYYVNRG